MNGREESNGVAAEEICLSCGMCCNGVIFADVQFQPGDDAGRMRQLGLVFRGKGEKFRQPCAAYDGCRCRIYGERPKYCREFECLLPKRVKGGEAELGEALHLIQKTQQQVETVKGLLRALGDKEETLALSKRFRRMSRRLEQTGFDENTAERFGKLTLAVHDLNLLLSGSFYPGAGG